MNCAEATAGLYVCTLTYLHTIVDYFHVLVLIMPARHTQSVAGRLGCCWHLKANIVFNFAVHDDTKGKRFFASHPFNGVRNRFYRSSFVY